MYAHGTLKSIARDYGMTADALQRAHLNFLEEPAAAQAKLDAWYTTIEDKHRGNTPRLDSTERRDGLAAFTTSALAQQLAPVVLPSQESFLFVPGRTGDRPPLLPVRQTVPLGMERVEWEVLAHTGEAREVGKGGLSGLKFVGEEEDKKFHSVAMYGIAWKWDQFDLWRQVHLGRNLPDERRMAGAQFMAEKSEQYGGEGNLEREIPGFLNHNASTTITLAKSFGDPTLTSDELWEQLKIMDYAWGLANPRRAVSGVLMPKAHRLNMISIFHGQNKEGVNAWKWAQEAFPWLSNIVEDERMLTASQTGGPMWQLWSNDPQNMWRETQASPMIFGPFNSTELDTMFISLQQDGGVVNRLPRLIFRFNQPG